MMRLFLKIGRMCAQEELGHLSSLWTNISHVMDQFNNWKQTPWDAIDVDLLIEETKKLLKDIKTLNKAIRSYPAYKYNPLSCCNICPYKFCMCSSTPLIRRNESVAKFDSRNGIKLGFAIGFPEFEICAEC